MLYTAVWICFPRMFLGVHYASDVVVGGVIGIAFVWVSLKVEWLQSRLGARVLSIADSKPEIFYPAAFLASFEMGILFDDVRGAASAVTHFVNFSSDRGLIFGGLGALVAMCAAPLTARLVLVRRSRHSSLRGHRIPR
jgi:hypothetical protein